MLSIKWMQNREREDIVTAGAVNYIVAFLAAIPSVWHSGALDVSRRAILTGGSMGVSYFLAFFFAIYAVRWIGAAGSTVISALSLVVPIICGIFVWQEQPNAFQSAGIVLALLSLLLISNKRAKPSEVLEPPTNERHFGFLMLLIFFALCGCARLAQAAFKHVCAGEPASHFTLASFMLAAIPSALLLIVRRKPIRRSELGFGMLMGLANALQIQFMIKALSDLDSYIVFPVASAGGLMLTTLVATWLLSERLSRIAYMGITLACLALILLNWQPTPRGDPLECRSLVPLSTSLEGYPATGAPRQQQLHSNWQRPLWQAGSPQFPPLDGELWIGN